MPDPIVKILIQDQTPPPGPPKEGGAPGGGTSPPTPAPPGGRGGRRGQDQGQGEEHDPGHDIGQAIRGFIGRRLPGGQAILRFLGLDSLFDDLGRALSPLIGQLRDSLRQALGTATKPPEGDKSSTEDREGRRGQKLPDGNKSYLEDREGRRGQPPVDFGGKAPEKKEDENPFSPERARQNYMDAKPKQGLPENLGSMAPKAEGGGAGGGIEAEAAAGGLEGALGAAGAIALPILVAQLAFDKLGDMAEGAAHALHTVAEFGADLAQNNPGRALMALGQGAADLAEKVPIVGHAASGLIKAFLTVVDAAHILTDAFLGRAKQLGQYSAPISVAEAQAEVRKTLADLREANRLGGDMGRLIEAQSRIDTAFQDALLPIKEAMLRVLIPLMERFATWLENVSANMEHLGEVKDEVVKMTEMIFPALGFLEWATGHIGLFSSALELFGKDEKKPDENWNDLLKVLENIQTDVDRPGPGNPDPGLPPRPPM